MSGTACLAGNAYHVPSQVFWDGLVGRHPYLLLIFLAVVTVFGGLTPVETWTSRSRVDRDVTIRRQVLNSFGHLLRLGANAQPPLPTSDLALHFWKRRRTWKRPITGVLSRVASYRLGTTPMNRPFTPPKGVGVVGLCWKHNQEVGVNVEELAEKLTAENQFEDYKREHGGDAVMNLSWKDFSRVKHRGAVFATPITNGRQRFVGCVSVDASYGFNELDGDELRSQMNLLSLVMSQTQFEVT